MKVVASKSSKVLAEINRLLERYRVDSLDGIRIVFGGFDKYIRSPVRVQGQSSEGTRTFDF